jgi:pyridoxal phosphate enzyme (YggS family)
MAAPIPGLGKVRAQIAATARRWNRDPAKVELLAISKTRSVEEILTLVRCGQRQFGENYLREAVAKITALSDQHLCWHFVGPIQSNKTRDISTYFDWVHTLERSKIAQRLNDQRGEHKQPLQVLIQVNIDAEPTKSGVAPERAYDLARKISSLPNLRLRGLMALPAPRTDFDEQRRPFAKMRELLDALRSRGLPLEHLSMGTSDDYQAAIAEGATILRIGTALFGPRPPVSRR